MAIFILPGIIFLLTLAFGVWLSHSGKPYNGLLFNVHKLIALGTVIATVFQLFKVLENNDPPSSIVIFLVFAGICVVVLFATGALMSLGKLSYSLMRTIHRIAPAALAIFMSLAVYLLIGGHL